MILAKRPERLAVAVIKSARSWGRYSLERSIYSARRSRRLRIFDLDPGFRRSQASIPVPREIWQSKGRLGG
jgi:hypothetical protein